MSFFHSVKLVVVDSVASVFHPVLGGKQMDSKFHLPTEK